MKRLLPSSTFIAILTLSVGAVLFSNCARELLGDDPPLDRPHYPVGSAVHPSGQRLAVVSSNFDLEFNRGTILLADLEAVDAAIDAAGESVPTLDDVYIDGGYLASFGGPPLFTQSGAHLFVPTRGENQLAELTLSDELALNCAPKTSTDTCGEVPNVLQLPGNDPFEIAILNQGEAGDRVSGVAALVASPELVFFDLRPEREDSARLRLQSPTLALGNWITGDDVAVGTRGLAVRNAKDGVPQTIFAAVERTVSASSSVELVHFDARSNATQFSVLPIQELTASRSARAITLNANQDALYILLRTPDALARIDLTTTGTTLQATLANVIPTCEDPTSIKSISVGGQERVLVTCLENDAIVSYDAQTLDETARLRFVGRGPFHIATDMTHEPPRAYISHFDDDSIAVIDLEDEGLPTLKLRARIGTPRPLPEDSRQ